MNYSAPAFPVLFYLLEFAQTHVCKSVVPSNHLILCCPLLLLSSIFLKHQGLFQWVGSSHQVATALICLFWIFYISETIHYVLICSWILLLSIKFTSFIHIVACISTSFFFYCQLVLHCMDTTCFIYLFIDGYFIVSTFLAIVSKDAMNIYAHVSMWCWVVRTPYHRHDLQFCFSYSMNCVFTFLLVSFEAKMFYFW